MSRLFGAVPVISGVLAGGTGHGVQPVELRLEACEYSGALLSTVRKALPSLIAVARRRRSDTAHRRRMCQPAPTPTTRRPPGRAGLRSHPVGWRDSVGIRDDNRHVRRQVVSEIGAQLIADLARRGRCR